MLTVRSDADVFAALLIGMLVKSLAANSGCLIPGCGVNCSFIATGSNLVADTKSALNCRDKNLTAIPDFQQNVFSKIDLGNNLMHEIQANVFANQTDLESLIIDNNFIEDVSVAAFNVRWDGESNPVSPLKFLDFRDNHLHYFPPCFGRTNSTIASFDNLQTLLIGGNLFGAHLEMDSFAGIRNVQKLEISRSLIRIIGDLTFKKLPRLQILDLSFNKIHQMSPMIFAQDVRLETLKLEENRLAIFPENLPSTLKELQLSSNQIESLHQKDYLSLKKLKNLQILDLSKNKIVYILPCVFSNNTRLQYLDLSWNSMEIIEKRTFDGLNSLEVLFLHNNRKLLQMSDFSIEILPKLNHLFLHQCSLGTLEIDENGTKTEYPPLKSLWLFGNPLTCDCYILPLVKFLKRENVKLDSKLRCVLANVNSSHLHEKLSAKFSKLSKPRSPTMCTTPLNRHHKVVGIPILSVSESYFTCPDEPIYIAISCFLGIIAFVGVIPVVFVLILSYLSILRFVQARFGFEKEKEE